MTLINLENINLKKGKKSILQDISLKIEENDFTTIIGPNGAGKTSLLHIILDIVKADSGNIQRQDDLRIGYVPQNLATNQAMPVLVQYFLTLHNNTSNEQLTKIIEQTNISHILKQNLFELSGGELQRVLLARSLLNDPQLLILDEPTQNLDISGQLSFYKLLENIRKDKKIAILMVSHDLHMVMSSTKKVICLYHHICCSGKPDAVTQNPEFKQIFGDDMSKIMSVYNHFHNHNHG